MVHANKTVLISSASFPPHCILLNQKNTDILHVNFGQNLNHALKNDAEISGRCASKDTAHLMEISVSFINVLQDITTNVHDALCIIFSCDQAA